MSRHHNLLQHTHDTISKCFLAISGFISTSPCVGILGFRCDALPVLVLDYWDICMFDVYLYTSLFITATVYTISLHLAVYYIPIPPSTSVYILRCRQILVLFEHFSLSRTLFLHGYCSKTAYHRVQTRSLSCIFPVCIGPGVWVPIEHDSMSRTLI